MLALLGTGLVLPAAAAGTGTSPAVLSDAPPSNPGPATGSALIQLNGDPLATYVQEPDSLCRSNIDRDYGNMLRVVRRHGDLLGRRAVRRWEAEVFRKWAARYLAGGRPRAALRPAWKRLLKDPASSEGWWVLFKSGLTACCRSA